jgi:hypothetical protein
MSYGFALAIVGAVASQLAVLIHCCVVLHRKNTDIQLLFDIYLAASALSRVISDLEDEDIACVDEWDYMRLKQLTSKFQQELDRRG